MNPSQNSIRMTTTRTIARTVGILLLAAFILSGIGNAIATRAAGDGGMLALGVAMMLANSVAVLTIGAILVPVLRPQSSAVARVYLTTRIFEASFLSLGAVALLAGSTAINITAYNIAMAGLGIGSLFFCVLLYRTGLVPRLLAVGGFVGYAAFAAGSVIALAGVPGAGLIGAVPGGLFEIVFAVWLLARGFATPVVGTDAIAGAPRQIQSAAHS